MRRRVRARLRGDRRGTLPFGRLVVAASAGAVALGGPGAVIGVGLAAAWDRIAVARAARTRATRMDEQIPDVLRAVSAAVRAGRSLPQALEAAHEEAAEPVAAALGAALARLEVGAPVDDVLETFARTADTDLARVAAETLRVGRAAGGDFPRVLDTAVVASNERLRIARDRRAATSQARMSAAVVGGMPVAFYGLIGSGARDRLLGLLAEPAGWLIVGGGVALELAGVAWMRAMSR